MIGQFLWEGGCGVTLFSVLVLAGNKASYTFVSPPFHRPNSSSSPQNITITCDQICATSG